MNPAIILGKPTPGAIIRLFLPESTRLIDHQQIFGRESRELMPRPCQNTRLSAPTDCNLAEWVPPMAAHRKLTRKYEGEVTTNATLADDIFWFRAMALRAPRSGTLDIRTKSKLAEYAENLRKEWNEEKARLKLKWNAKKKKQHQTWAQVGIHKKNTVLNSRKQLSCSEKWLWFLVTLVKTNLVLSFLEHYNWFFYVCC